MRIPGWSRRRYSAVECVPDWILTEEELPADPDEVVLVQISGSPKKTYS